MTAACATEPPRFNFPPPSRAGVVDTLIVSDLHLGLPAARPGALLALLEERRFDRLILLGDFFHDGSSRHLCADARRLLAHVRRLSHRREAEVVWVLGNHDRHLGHLAAALLGVETTEAFRWNHAGRAFAAVHGDRFDGFVSRHVRMAGFLSRSYAFAQRRLPTGGWPKLLDRLHAGSSGLSERVEEGAFGYATSHDVDVIVCGHTHRPRRTVFDVPGPAGGLIEYFNTGCWVNRPASFVTVGASGGVALDHRPWADDRDKDLANALVRDAALQAAAASERGILERVFARMFEGLVYAQIWEDPEVDLAALQLGPTSRVVTIASGGCNAMSYLVADPACVQAVDLDPARVASLKFKLAAARHRPEVEATLRALAGVGVRVKTAEIGRRYALLHRLGRRGLGGDPRAAGD